MNFTELVHKAPVRTMVANFKGLFDVELIITPNNEIRTGVEGAVRDVLNTTTGKYEAEEDSQKMREFIASKVAGFKGLSLGKAMTLCGRELPEEMQGKATEPLVCEKETVETLLLMVVGLDRWCMQQLVVSGAEAARREAKAQGN